MTRHETFDIFVGFDEIRKKSLFLGGKKVRCGYRQMRCSISPENIFRESWRKMIVEVVRCFRANQNVYL